MKIGKRIRGLRKERDMTLAELSEKSGVALATLSRIENEKMIGTVESHMKISEAFGLSLPQLYTGLGPEEKTPVEVHPRAKRTDVFVHNEKSSFELLTKQVMDKKMMPIVLKINADGTTHKEENQKGAEKFLYLLEGKVEAYIGDEKYMLKKGDTLYFDASVPHYWKNVGKTEARCLCVMTPPAL